MTAEHPPTRRRWLQPVTVLGLYVVALAAWTLTAFGMVLSLIRQEGAPE